MDHAVKDEDCVYTVTNTCAVFNSKVALPPTNIYYDFVRIRRHLVPLDVRILDT
jgi:hypothetical protein